MATEPTYSQIEAAADALAQEMGLEDADSMVGARTAAKAALIAAHGVDPNIYGDMHYGWSCDGVTYMCNSVEAQRRLNQWHHDSTGTVPSLRAHIEQLGKEVVRLNDLIVNQQRIIDKHEDRVDVV